MSLYPDYFFDLSEYRHKSLFKPNKFVWLALNELSKYLETLFLGKIEVEVPVGTFLIDSHLISIGKGTVIEPGAYIKGPCYIGENCTIRHGAYIRGNFLAGDNCVIGHDTEVKNAIFLNHVHAAHFAYVGDSILGNDVNLGAGTKCANLKLDNQQVVLYYQNKNIETGLKKIGAVIGDRTQIGCNSVTNPGTFIGQDVLCYPCLNIGGIIDSQSIVKGDVILSIKKRMQK